MKIRVMGLPVEVDAAVSALRAAVDVVSVSSAYPCRGDSREVRVYVEARPRGEAK